MIHPFERAAARETCFRHAVRAGQVEETMATLRNVVQRLIRLEDCPHTSEGTMVDQAVDTIETALNFLADEKNRCRNKGDF